MIIKKIGKKKDLLNGYGTKMSQFMAVEKEAKMSHSIFKTKSF